MKIKTYMCQSMEEALRTIRLELGPDAIIISSLNEGEKIRVTAACEKIPDHIAHPPAQAPHYTPRQTKNYLCHILAYHGVPHAISDAIMTESFNLSSPLLEEGIARIFKELLSFSPLQYVNSSTQPQQIMLAGPVGVGKTVTLSKIASEYKLKSQKVEIISADSLKAGAPEQIQAYAQALSVPLTFIKTATQLEQKLANAQPGVTYLIDTPGTNPLDPHDIQQLTDFILASKQAPYLVLATGGDPYETQETAAAFKDVGSTRLIMTRFDTAKRFGGLLALLFKERLEFSALSCGPEIGSRLQSANSNSLLSVLEAYLPKSTESKNLPHPPLSQPTTHPSQPPSETKIPEWVKGFTEAKKA